MDLYSYDFCPLKDPATDLRILKIEDNGRTPIECRLSVNRDNAPYDTLSWCWGPRGQAQAEKEIRILHNERSYSFPISENLEAALQELRNQGVLFVWIDAICIHQANNVEKNNQVPMMASIYGNAQCVYVWLGGERDDSELALDFIRDRVLNLNDFDRLINDQRTSREWKALSALMKREWFSRRWIVQEIALAREATILCGHHKISWIQFADALSLFNEVETGTRSLTKIMRRNADYGNMPDFFGHVPAFSATRLVEITNNLFRKLSDGKREPILNLENLVSDFTSFNATEARDTIYALLAIAKDTVPETVKQVQLSEQNLAIAETLRERIKKKFIDMMSTKRVLSRPYNVDYALPVSDVYVEFVKFCTSRSDRTRALDILCRPWAPPPSQESGPGKNGRWRALFKESESRRPADGSIDSLPSWIPSLDNTAFGKEEGGQTMVRKNADTLVGIPPQRNYMAAGNRTVTDMLRFEDAVETDHENDALVHYHSLFVEGLILDKVALLGYPSQQGEIPKDWLKMGRREGDGTDPADILPEDFWRTLVADRGPNSENAPRYYPRLLRWGIEQGVRGAALNTTRIIDRGGCEMAGNVLRRVQSVIWGRRLMRTESDGRLGLAPEAAQAGDLVCMLYGCSVPVLLREFTKTDDEIKQQEQQRENKRQELQEKEKEVGRKIVAKLRRRIAAQKATAIRTTTPEPFAQAEPESSCSPQSTRKRKATRKPARGISQKRPKIHHLEESAKTGLFQEPVDGANQQGGVTGERKDTFSTTRTVKSDKKVFYNLVGECYVHGMMNGEAISMGKTSELFELR
jgi:hypothetical protein